jgi:hypothetical protein
LGIPNVENVPKRLPILVQVINKWIELCLLKLFSFRLSILRITVSGLAKVAIFTTNVDAENQTLINHKCVCGALNRHFCQTRVIASGFCPPSLQTIVSIEFLCHCRVGCALRFLFFFRSVGNFLKTILSYIGFASSLTKLWSVRWLGGFGNVLAKCVGYLLICPFSVAYR